MKALFERSCPNCGASISDDRLNLGLPCSKCFPFEEKKSAEEIAEYLKEKGNLQGYSYIYKLEQGLEEFKELFVRIIGSEMWNAQEVWAKRLLSGESFAIIAPTGLGKTVFGLIASLYFAKKGLKSYLIFPTSLLAKQAHDKLIQFSKKLDFEVLIVGYYTGVGRRKKVKEAIKKEDYDVLVTTERFLVTNFDLVKDKKFEFIFVDDVDSFLRSSKNVDKVLMLLGIPEDYIKKTFELIGKKDEQLEIIRKEVKKLREEGKIGNLIVSSATIRARRTKRIKLFRHLLGFEIGFSAEFLRNIEDIEVKARDQKDVLEKVYEIVKKCGFGCFVFVPSALGREFGRKVMEFLENKGIRCYLYEKMQKDILDKFISDEYQILIGVASYRSPLARGVDLPEKVRYVIFAGVPRREILLSPDTVNPVRLLILTQNFADLVEDERKRIDLLKQADLLKKIRWLQKEEMEEIERAIKEGLEKVSENLSFPFAVIKRTQEILKELITPEFLKKIKESKELSLVEREGQLYLVIPDPIGYIQASGRASRLYAKGISKGASFLIVDEEKAFVALKRRVRWFIEEMEWKDISEVDLERLFEEIDRDRKAIRDIREGKITEKEKEELIRITLLIVESPTKARIIARLFGRPGRRRYDNIDVFESVIGKHIINVVATKGHVFDLVTDKFYHGVKVNEKIIPVYGPLRRCRNCGEQFVSFDTCPKCGSANIDKKEKILEILRRLAVQSNLVLIGTDPDREGEKIAWDIYLYIKPYNPNIRRIEFHEVTRRGILTGISNLRDIDENLVKAQIARRIEDRWVGFELSQRLWDAFYKGLSAGRVQSPVLGWIVERTKNLRKRQTIFRVKLENNVWFSFSTQEVTKKKEVEEFAEKIKEVDWKVEVEESEREIVPRPPFSTDTMIKEANRVLKFSATKTMQIAQELFELGLCLTGDTLVMLKDGRIEEIRNLNKIGERVIGITNLRENNGIITKFWKIKWKGPIYKIKLENGNEIRATPDHPFFILRNGKFGWVSSKNLKEEDYLALIHNFKGIERRSFSLLELLEKLGITNVILEFEKSFFSNNLKNLVARKVKTSTKYKYLKNHALPLYYLKKFGIDLKDAEKHVKSIYRQVARTKKIPYFKLDENFWYLAGFVLGDGSLRGSKVSIAQKPALKAEKLINSTLPFVHVFVTHNQATFSNSLIAEIFRRLGLRRGRLKGLIFSLPEKFVNSFIAGFFDSDGCVSLLYDKNTGKHNLRICLSSKRKAVLQKIAFYLASLGILTYLRKDKRTGVYELIVSNRSLEKFITRIGKYLRFKKRKLTEYYSIYKKEHKRRGDYDLLPFASILRKIGFKRGKKAFILKRLGIDVWNWLKKQTERIPRDKLVKCIECLREGEEREILKALVEAPLTWVKIEKIEKTDFNGYVYDITVSTENFFANGILSHNCTYHRTDATTVSSFGINLAKEYISEKFGEQFFVGRSWKLKEGAHECIRPTRAIDANTLAMLVNRKIYRFPRKLTRDHYMLYNLIFKRFIASQMKPCKVKVQKVKISSELASAEVERIVEIIEEGFNKISPLRIEERLQPGILKAVEVRYRRVPLKPPYTQGEIIAEMKEKGIGRPSTYAKIIETLLEEKYVKDLKGRIIATRLGFKVYQYLKQKYGHFVSEDLTREMEENLDKIEEGKLDYQQFLRTIYEQVKKLP